MAATAAAEGHGGGGRARSAAGGRGLHGDARCARPPAAGAVAVRWRRGRTGPPPPERGRTGPRRPERTGGSGGGSSRLLPRAGNRHGGTGRLPPPWGGVCRARWGTGHGGSASSESAAAAARRCALPVHREGSLVRGVPGLHRSSWRREERSAREGAAPAAAAGTGEPQGAWPRPAVGWAARGEPLEQLPVAWGEQRKQLTGSTYIQVVHGGRRAFVRHLLQELGRKQAAVGAPNAWLPPIPSTHPPHTLGP